MAKKTTRQRKEITQQRAIQQAAANVAQAVSASRVEAPSAAATARAATPTPTARGVDVHEEYQHIRSELKRIAILAMGITATLIVLSFILR
jgi:hypothetical protein